MRRRTPTAAWLRIACLGFLSSCLPLAAAPAGAAAESGKGAQGKGYTCVLLGHSFFAPTAKMLSAHPARCGFTGHRQLLGSGGGPNGSPGKLWETIGEEHPIRQAIRSGTVDLVGLTYYPGVGSEVADYRKWIDFALKHNAKARFFIMAPWPMYQGKTLEAYEALWKNVHREIHGLIDPLREAYPGTTIFCIPQGQGMVELRRLLEQKRLPEVAVLMRPDKESRASCLFTDSLGHGGDAPTTLGVLLWLAAIYKVDVREYAWDTGYQTDLKALAWKIAQDDPYADSGAVAP